MNSLGYKLGQIWPAKPAPNIPEFIPASVERVLLQAESNFMLPSHEDAASTMYRKALEIGLKSIDGTLDGTLAKKIEMLGKTGRLTADLVTWSKEIKNLGNEGAHDEHPITREELASLRGLTDMVFRYLFTLPAMVEQRKNERSGKNPI